MNTLGRTRIRINMGRIHVKDKGNCKGYLECITSKREISDQRQKKEVWREFRSMARLKKRSQKEGMLVNNPVLEQVDNESFGGKVKRTWVPTNKDCFVIINPWTYIGKPKVQRDHGMKENSHKHEHGGKISSVSQNEN
jgi:hypothetical protein